ncbi:MAG: hypothetical protein AAGC55_25655, partial [Myxococcota bacterium]
PGQAQFGRAHQPQEWSSAELRLARMMGSMFSYGPGGYRQRGDGFASPQGPGFGFVDADGASSEPFGAPSPSADAPPRAYRVGRKGFNVHRPMASGGFTIRQRNGRFVIEILR